MRGETPESLALRKALNKSMGRRDVALANGNGRRQRQSRAADFYLSTTSSDSRTTSSNEDIERMGQPNDKAGRGGNGSGSGGGGFRRLTTGWRGGVVMNASVSFLVLITTIVCLTVALGKAQMFGGEQKIFSGGCARAGQVNLGLHVAINVVAVSLVAIANYVFQVLSSPTRNEVSTQHDLKRWLDIGIPSIRNLRAISSTRVLLIAAVLLAALSTQVM